MPKYIFFDIDDDLLNAYAIALSDIDNVEVCDEPTDLRDLEEIDAFVSPANSYGYMNGGIDAIYSQIFPNVQKILQSKISKLGFRDISGRAILPVGSATIVTIESIGTNQSFQLICAPTMHMPGSPINTPENILHAMYAILKVTEYLPRDYIVAVPGLGTGLGNLSRYESAKQIRKAFEMYYSGLTPNYPENKQIQKQGGDSFMVY